MARKKRAATTHGLDAKTTLSSEGPQKVYAGAAERDLRIDTIRGLLLIIMTIGHLGGPIGRITYQASGYVSVAEGFIFLSAFVFSIVYLRYAAAPTNLLFRSLKRALTIYQYHAVMVIGIPAIAFMIPSLQGYWSNWLGPGFFSEPALHIKNALLLLHQPTFMDILPMYFLFVLGSPVILLAFHSGQEKRVLIASCLLWMLGQYADPLKILSNRLCAECQPGYFNVLAWQTIWVFGMYVGFRRRSGRAFGIMQNKMVIVTVFGVAAALFLSRHGILNLGINPGHIGERSHLDWLRLLNFSALVFVVSQVIQNIPAHQGVPGVEFIGKYSLQVYTYHVLVLYCLWPVQWRVQKWGGEIGYAVFTVLVVLSLMLPALAYRKYKNA